MSQTDELLATIETVHAAGLDAQRWPDALAAVTQLCGGVASTLEIFDKPALAHRGFHAFGVPPLHEIAYADRYLALNPRVPYGLRQRAGEIGWDYQFIDEAGMARDAFYAEFLPRISFRYFLSGVVTQTSNEFVALAVQRSPAQGHVGAVEITVMERLLPHFRQALDVAQRLNGARRANQALTEALGWLADGVLLVDADGAVSFANEAAQAVCRHGDGVGIAKGALTFAAAQARACFDNAIAEVLPLGAAQVPGTQASADFPVPRPSGAPSYVVSVRPCGRDGAQNGCHPPAAALVFIRDPLVRGTAGRSVLRELFGFTEAEADMAHALQAGGGLAAYAHERAISLNTAYTHLRRIREKTGCRRMADLIRKLDSAQPGLRAD